MTASPRPVAAYVHGIDAAPVVVLPARVCVWLERHADLQQLRRRHRGTDPEVDAVLVAIAVAAAAWREQQTQRAEHGPEQDKHPAPTPRSPLTTAQAAAMLGVDRRTIRKLCSAGRLDARRHGDRWLVDHESVALYRSRAA